MYYRIEFYCEKIMNFAKLTYINLNKVYMNYTLGIVLVFIHF